MVSGKTKRIVVIKDIHSNIIEEAILILKNDIDTSKLFSKEKKDKQKGEPLSNKSDSDYMMNEARLIIDNYIKESKAQAEFRNGLNINHAASRGKFSIGLFLNLTLIGIIIFLLMILLEII